MSLNEYINDLHNEIQYLRESISKLHDETKELKKLLFDKVNDHAVL